MKLLFVFVRVTINGLMEYVQGNLLLFIMQLKGRFKEFVAGLNYEGRVRIIFEPFTTVELSTGSKDIRRGPKYPAVIALYDVKA